MVKCKDTGTCCKGNLGVHTKMEIVILGVTESHYGDNEVYVGCILF